MPPAFSLNNRKIVVIGAQGIGKSSLVTRFIHDEFTERYHPSTETRSYRTISYHGTDYPCEIIDTEGQHGFSQLKSQHVIGIHGYILVYSITCRESFDLIQTIYDKILDYSGVPEISAIVVGTLADLHMSREVDSKDGQRFAERNKAAWIEASALCNENVEKVFTLCLAQIEKKNVQPLQRHGEPGKSYKCVAGA
ncbi:small GTPase superfamily [Mycena polygramma]|nr:small GTPase superfamily [Mycena polygramma]